MFYYLLTNHTPCNHAHSVYNTITTTNIARNVIQTPTNHTICYQIINNKPNTMTDMGSYKYQKFSPIRYHNNLQFVNK